ncbi:hypothetical protein [Glycomyces sp. NPDC021274]|uniref:hypothetical protein n=1 Tax=Glycomyces sp. NPDC021274 TaxID=3155120 RepID=UPI0033D4ADDC
MSTIETRHELDAALDYLPVAVRAADRNPDSEILWAEAYHAQRAVIEAADERLPEYQSARVQAAVGSIAGLAVLRDDLAVVAGAYGGESMATRSERAKSRIRALITAPR